LCSEEKGEQSVVCCARQAGGNHACAEAKGSSSS
jgi:hypothetical protein